MIDQKLEADLRKLMGKVTVSLPGQFLVKSGVDIPTGSNYRIGGVDQGIWTAWTPTPVNMTVGNGTFTCSYLRMGSQVEVAINFILGSTSAVGSNPYIPLPFTNLNRGIWQVLFDDSGTASFIGYGQALSGRVYFYRRYVSGSDLLVTGISATVPFTWTTGDILLAHGIFGV